MKQRNESPAKRKRRRDVFGRIGSLVTGALFKAKHNILRPLALEETGKWIHIISYFIVQLCTTRMVPPWSASAARPG